jgi:hypothetical protein
MMGSEETKIAVMEERQRGVDRALTLQAAEYERRLLALNGEADRIRDILASTVTAEKFDDYVQAQREALELALKAVTAEIAAVIKEVASVERRLLILENDDRNREKAIDKTTRWMLAGIGFGLSALVIVLNLLTGS